MGFKKDAFASGQGGGKMTIASICSFLQVLPSPRTLLFLTTAVPPAPSSEDNLPPRRTPSSASLISPLQDEWRGHEAAKNQWSKERKTLMVQTPSLPLLPPPAAQPS